MTPHKPYPKCRYEVIVTYGPPVPQKPEVFPTTDVRVARLIAIGALSDAGTSAIRAEVWEISPNCGRTMLMCWEHRHIDVAMLVR